jgi:hypothetical protein
MGDSTSVGSPIVLKGDHPGKISLYYFLEHINFRFMNLSQYEFCCFFIATHYLLSPSQLIKLN